MYHRALTYIGFACLFYLSKFPLHSVNDEIHPPKIRRAADSGEVDLKLWEIARYQNRPWMYGEIEEAVAKIGAEEMAELQGKLKELQPIIASVQKRTYPPVSIKRGANNPYDGEETSARLVYKPSIDIAVGSVQRVQRRLEDIRTYKKENP